MNYQVSFDGKTIVCDQKKVAEIIVAFCGGGVSIQAKMKALNAQKKLKEEKALTLTSNSGKIISFQLIE